MAEKLVDTLGGQIVERNKLKKELLDLECKRAIEYEKIDQQRQPDHQKLLRALMEYEEQTRKIKSGVEEKYNFSERIDQLEKEVKQVEERMAVTLEELQKHDQPFTIQHHDSMLKFTMTLAQRSREITLRNIAEALVKCGVFKDLTTATKTIQAYNKADVPILKVTNLMDGSSIALEKLLPKKSKKRKPDE